MIISNISVTNFKGLKKCWCSFISIQLYYWWKQWVNPSFMQALLLFLKGNRLSQMKIIMIVQKMFWLLLNLCISEDELEALGEGHRDKLKKFISNDGKLILARRYGNDGKSSLRNVGYFSKLVKYSKKINENFQGKKERYFRNIKDNLSWNWYYRQDYYDTIKCKEIVDEYIEQMLPSEKELKDVPLESGFDNTISAFFLNQSIFQLWKICQMIWKQGEQPLENF